VIASARKKSDVEALCNQGFEAIELNLDDSSSIHTGVDLLLEKTGGKLYALFNNGAYGQPGAVEDLTRDSLRAQFESNVFGWLELTNRLIPVMRKQGEGRIIQNSSVLGFAAMPYRGAYNSSKFAIEGLSDTLRLELHGSNVFVSLIQPGPIKSRFREHALQAFKDNIDYTHSAHSSAYKRVLARLEKQGPGSTFTLGPEHVLKRVIWALESKHPKARYPVTFPTYLFGLLKRILPTRLLDALLRNVE
jgi:NAD(P)-dependent dehydrogenase (short-subunit alcohol dehydrogenase family)